jgi:hypothetical protein
LAIAALASNKKNTAAAGRRQSSFASQETETASLAGKQCRKSQAIVCIGEKIFFSKTDGWSILTI